MWIICEDREGVNISSATHLEVAKSEDVEEGHTRPFAVVARFAWQGFMKVVCTRDTKAGCYEAIQEITDEMCGWIDPTQRHKGDKSND